ncbi:MAG: hypothetical protein GY754_41365 [bacterium]|nr:hypothetical protein [bacterium]
MANIIWKIVFCVVLISVITAVAYSYQVGETSGGTLIVVAFIFIDSLLFILYLKKKYKDF